MEDTDFFYAKENNNQLDQRKCLCIKNYLTKLMDFLNKTEVKSRVV